MLLQNQSTRKFILPEGVLEPKETIDISEERAEILSKEYTDELVILQVAQPNEAKVEEIKEEKAVEEPKIEKALEELDVEELRKMCDEKGIKYHHMAGQKKLLELLKGE